MHVSLKYHVELHIQAYINTFMHACIQTYRIQTYRQTFYIQTYIIHTNIHYNLGLFGHTLHTCIHYMHTLHAYIACIHYIHNDTYRNTYMHTYICTYIHACILTQTYTDTDMCSSQIQTSKHVPVYIHTLIHRCMPTFLRSYMLS